MDIYTDELLTPDDLASVLGIPKRTLYHWRYEDEGPPAIRVGRHLRYRRSEFEAWLAGLDAKKGW